MALKVDASFDDGVFVPAQRPALADHERVRLTIEPARQMPARRLTAKVSFMPDRDGPQPGGRPLICTLTAVDICQDQRPAHGRRQPRRSSLSVQSHGGDRDDWVDGAKPTPYV